MHIIDLIDAAIYMLPVIATVAFFGTMTVRVLRHAA